MLKTDDSLGQDDAVTKQGKGFVENFVGMPTYSAIMIKGEKSDKCGYGTRTHQVILVDIDNNCTFAEIDRKPDASWKETTETFKIDA